MSLFAAIFLVFNSIALLALPRRWAPLPLLVGACYMTLGQIINVGPLHFNIIRLLAVVGVIRILIRHERPLGAGNGLDRVMLAWALWALMSSAFHEAGALVFRMGLVYNTLGIYFLIRTFCQDEENLTHLIKITAVVLLPVAIEMTLEHLTGRNFFAFLGGVPESVVTRDEKFRAQGPFVHGILAGTVGAVCFPLMFGIWRKHGLAAKLGAAACIVIVFASNSSGPLMSLIFATLALIFWKWRHLTRKMRIAAVFAYIFLNLIMKVPAYYLLARIDLTGSSTGWHRAELIHTSIEHLNEWWFAGTDYTRHWMPTGVSWNENHTDITNHYLQYGVLGGLPLMGLFICALAVGFLYVGRYLRRRPPSSLSEQFTVWTAGVGLFTHAATCVSVSYFDQSFVFLFMNLAILGSLPAASRAFSRAHEMLETALADSAESHATHAITNQAI